MEGFDTLPFELIEELKAKNLFPFVNAEESTCNNLTIEVYENQKYRPVLREWGSVIGVHLFPPVDRKPHTNDNGSKALSCNLNDLRPVNGFKWAGEWFPVIDAHTDPNGFEYARNWGVLRSDKSTHSSERTLTFVRRRKWKRSMVVDLDIAKRSLPYELQVRIQVVPGKDITLPNLNLANTYIELFVNNQQIDSGAMGSPTWSKEFLIPLTHLDRTKSFSLCFSRNGKAIPTVLSSTNKGALGYSHINLGEIMSETSKNSSGLPQVVIKEKQYVVVANWKISENTLFHVKTVQHFFSEGQLSEMVLSEGKISLRLKEKIIMLSLGLGNNCNGLLKEITNLISEGQNKINDFDIIEVLDDLNQIQSMGSSHSKNEFGRVISFLRDAENANRRFANIIYPYSIPCFHDCVLLQLDGWQAFRPKKSLTRELLTISKYNQSWFERQPVCLPYVIKDYHSRWQRDMKSASSSSLASSYLYSIRLLLRGETSVFQLSWNHCYDYFTALKWISMIKYHTSGLYPSIDKHSNHISPVYEELSLHAMITIDSHIFMTGIFWVDFEEECIDFSCESNENSISREGELLPLRIPFDYIESVIVSHSHHLAMDRMLEIKLLSATSFTIQGSNEYACKIDIDTVTGQNFTVDFGLSQDGHGPATGDINETVRILLPRVKSSTIGASIENTLESYASLSFSVDQPQATSSTSSSSSSSSKTSSSSQPSGRTMSMASDAAPAPRFSVDNRKDSKRYFPSFSSGSSSTSAVSVSQPAVTYGSNDSFSVSMLNNNKEISMSTKGSNKKPMSHFVKIGSVALPSISGDPREEQEMQLVFEKKQFVLSLQLKQVQFLHGNMVTATDYDQDPDIYCLIFLTDRNGNVLPLASDGSGGGGNMLSPSKSKKNNSGANSVIANQRLGHLQRTSFTSLSDQFYWDDEEITLDSRLYPAVEHAGYFLLEVWRKNKLDEDHCLGETFLPINTTNMSNPAGGAGATNSDSNGGELVVKLSNALGQFLIRAPSTSFGTKKRLQTHCTMYDIGYLYARVTIKPFEAAAGSGSQSMTSTGPGHHRMRHHMRSNILKIKVNCKPIQPTDCAWPCQILSSSEKILEPTVYHFTLAQDGIHIQLIQDANGSMSTIATSSSTSASNAATADRISVLEDCVERKSPPGQPLHLLVLYTVIDLQDLFVLSDHTMYIALKLRRQFQQSTSNSTSNPSTSSNNVPKSIYREIRIEMIVGPCLAEDLFASICNRVALQPIRSQLLTHVSLSPGNAGSGEMSGEGHIGHSQQKELEESFNRLAKMFQEHIYETITSIEQRNNAIYQQSQENGYGNNADGDDADVIDEEEDPGIIAQPVGGDLARGSMRGSQGSGNGEDGEENFENTRHSKIALLDVSRDYDGQSNNDADTAGGSTALSGVNISNALSKSNLSSIVGPILISNLEEEWNRFVASNHCSCAMKLLYLKLATLKVYLWFLVEQTPIQFNAEKHYLDASWILFDENGVLTDLSNDTNNGGASNPNAINVSALDFDSLIFRITDMMRKLEQEVRHQIFRAYRVNSSQNHSDAMEDITESLSKIVYDKYTGIATLLLETVQASEITGKSNATNGNDGASNGGQLVKTPSFSSTTSISAKDNGKGGSGKGGTSGKAFIISNPQKKRDLIKFIITNDDIFENYLNAILRSHRYEFSHRPLLSLCINFDDLIKKFGDILDENILMWNSRTLKHFMNSSLKQQQQQAAAAASASGSNALTRKGSASGSAMSASGSANAGGNSDNSARTFVLPWDITTLYDKGANKELPISNIPETIQTQLNVEIGLKKVAPNLHTLSNQLHNPLSLHRIDLLNHKIAQAIARSYVSLASEYEKVLMNVVIQPQISSSQHNTSSGGLRDSIVGSSGGNASGGLNRQSSYGKMSNMVTDYDEDEDSYAYGHGGNPLMNAESEEDQIITFLTSVVNDCFRIAHTHIPQSIDLFIADHQPVDIDELNNDYNLAMGMNHKNHDRHGHSKVDDDDIAATISFTTCLRAMNTLSLKVVNELTNQLFFQSELKYYYLLGMDEIYLKEQTKFIRYKTQFLSSAKNNNNNARNGGRGDDDDDHSPVDIILATMTEFLNFLSQQIHSEDLERIYFLLLKKLLLRYFLFIRDFHSYNAQFSKKTKGKNTTGNNGNQSGTSVVVNTRVEDLTNQVKDISLDNEDGEGGDSDAQQQYHQQLQHGRKDAGSGGDPVIARLKADVRQMTMFYSTTKTSLFTKPAKNASNKGVKKPDGGRNLHHNEAEDPEETGESRYDIMLGILFKKLQSVFVLTATNEWTGSHIVDEFLLQRFSITAPTFFLEPARYYPQIEQLFRSDPAFVHFVPPAVISDSLELTAVPMVTLQISNLACFQVKKYKNLFMKIQLNDTVHSTALQPNNTTTPQWEETIEFENIPVSSCKVLRIELYGFKLGVIKSMREYWVGTVFINLVDLLRSEMDAPSNLPGLHRGASFSGGNRPSIFGGGPRGSFTSVKNGTATTGSGTGFSHTSWYVAGNSGLLQKLRGQMNPNEMVLTSSTTGNIDFTEDKGMFSRKGGKQIANNTTTSSLSQVYALSSKSPRDDIDNVQIRATIRAVMTQG